MYIERTTMKPKTRRPKPRVDNDARLVVNVPARVHRAIKLRAVERGITIRDYILGLLRADRLPMG